MYKLPFLFLLCLLFSCQPSDKTGTSTGEVNPASPGFLVAESDPEAIKIADEVMLAMGGRAAWDAVDTLAWNFFGFRDLVWSKKSGEVTITSPKENSILTVNVFTGRGSARYGSKEIHNPDTLQINLEKAMNIWINDSYWLAMPFKLKDTGVRLKYLGDGTTEDNQAADKLELTFFKTGNTPNNKYHVYVDKKTRLVSQWDFFNKADDPNPQFKMPWKGYVEVDGILLSEDRGERKVKVVRDLD